MDKCLQYISLEESHSKGFLGRNTYLCKFEVWVDRPPNDEAIVLNSTCFIVCPSCVLLSS